ncbi:MAG: shikimate dehydrogenase [Acidobacteriia bacterium]|nr:shikimate dehydrogenase [Terriglobia bacterium]
MPRSVYESLCVPVAEPTARRALAAMEQAKKHARWIELRLDYLDSTRQIDELLSRLKGISHLRHTLIFTLRRRNAGGRFGGSIASQLLWLGRAATLGQWLDLEIETIRTQGTQIVSQLQRIGAKLIVSSHDFKETPTHLEHLAKQLLETGGDLIKIAVQANSLSDAARLLSMQCKLARRGHRSVVLGMGACGAVTRVLGPSQGAEFTYAALTRGKESASGQLTVSALEKIFRIDRINSRTRIYGLLGCPLSHSLSPALYNAAFAQLGINAIYLPFETGVLDDFPFWTKRLKVKGLSVTLPHKAGVVKFVSKQDPAARHVGVVNTLRRRQGRWFGYNTDARGIEKPLEELGLHLKESEVLLLGAGGAAQGVAAVLREKGAKVLILNRTLATAQKLARKFDHRVVRQENLRNHHFALIVNATSVGMWPEVNKVPIDLTEVSADVVFELIYNPPETRLLREARRRKMQTISGMKMFISQAEAQFKILTGKKLPTAIWQEIARRGFS